MENGQKKNERKNIFKGKVEGSDSFIIREGIKSTAAIEELIAF
jgi:hypothetical protein